MSSSTVLLENNQVSATENYSAVKTGKKLVYQAEITIGGNEVIEEIFDEWTVLCEEGASNEPFFRPEWFAAFVKNFGSEIFLVTVRYGGRLRAVLPLMRTKENFHGISVRKLHAVFNLNTQRFDLIHGALETERHEIVEALWTEIKKLPKWDVLEMRLVKKDSWLNDLLSLAKSERHPTGIWEMDGAPFIALPQGSDKEKLIDEYFKGSRRHLKQELNRRMRRLKELGKVEFAVSRRYSSQLIETYFELEARGWKGRGGTAVTCDPNVAALHNDFARAASAKNALFIYELKLDDKTIAMSVNIMYDRQTVHWKTSYDESYARYSPGNLLYRELLSDSIRRDSTEIDFLSPATSNKKFWASGERQHAAFYVFQPGIFGSLLWRWKFSVVSYLRRFKNQQLKTTVGKAGAVK